MSKKDDHKNKQPAAEQTAETLDSSDAATVENKNNDNSGRELIDKLQQELEQSQQAQSAAIAQSQRALADYANLKKRFEKERQELAQFAAESIVVQLLSGLDSLERAIAYASDQEKESGLYQGVKMTLQQIDQTLAQVGFQRMQIEPGKTQFDPHQHEPIEMVEGPKDTVIAVADSGYLLHDKVIRPARVTVGNGGK